LGYELKRDCPFGHESRARTTENKRSLLSDFFKWLIVGWSIVVVGIAALGMILIVKYGEVKKIETDDVSLCFIIAFFCWLIPIIAFTILARTLGF
jgi:heme/copper-type cytochrome/quinol oxidase subunit 2